MASLGGPARTGRHLCPKPSARSSDSRGGTLSNGKRVRATGARARTHLLGADEVVAEAAGLLLGQHDNLDGLLGEALLERGRRGKGAEGQSRAFGSSALVFFSRLGGSTGVASASRRRARRGLTRGFTRAMDVPTPKVRCFRIVFGFERSSGRLAWVSRGRTSNMALVTKRRPRPERPANPRV